MTTATSEGERSVKDPIALTRAGTPDVIAYACGACGIVAGSVMAHGEVEARHRAVECCAPRMCSCGKPTSAHYRLSAFVGPDTRARCEQEVRDARAA